MATSNGSLPPPLAKTKDLSSIGDGVGILQSRAYQLEMLEDSMRRNIIVVMDTGSGKTQIAILRIEAELEQCPLEKRVWFLCITVPLANQQFRYISAQLPSYRTKTLFLSGGDGVDRWKKQQIWDEILNDIRIVVCTAQVLLDALKHGFVKMSQIALLVFDEAHYCNGNHAYGRIMRDFYYPLNSGCRQEVPHVLGLTATPVINKKQNGPQIIEQNMNAISRTPKLHREELLRFVHRPSMKALFYKQYVPDHVRSHALRSLQAVQIGLDIEEDPYIIKLRSTGSDTDVQLLQEVRLGRKTNSQQQMQRLLRTAEEINLELGSWAADYYITSCVQKVLASKNSDLVMSDSPEEQEKSYLKRALEKIDCPPLDGHFLSQDLRISPKVNVLVQSIVKEVDRDFAGLVFVKTRASVAVLSHLLSVHGMTRNLISVGGFVGTSTSDKRKLGIGDLADIREQTNTLDDLRSRKKNLIIATSVLEEGIDVSACNVVICFEKPPNLKSFVQRRGRARKASSKYFVMLGEGEGSMATTIWQDLEEEMRKVYLDDMRQVEEIRNLEAEEEGYRELTVESTGAKITLLDAVQHLYHFCSTLPATQYADLKPLFTFEEDTEHHGISGRVILPLCVEASVREARSSTVWRTEKTAKRDAAFEAYSALYRVGLVNNNLLPLLEHDEAAVEAYSTIEKRPSLVSVNEQINPWHDLATCWRDKTCLYESVVSIRSNNNSMFQIRLLSPCSLPRIASFELFWNAYESYHVDIGHARNVLYDEAKLAVAQQITDLILSSIHKSRMKPDTVDYPLTLIPTDSHQDCRVWLDNARGTSHASGLTGETCVSPKIGLIRDLIQNGTPNTFLGIRSKPDDVMPEVDETGEMTEEAFYIKASKLPKRADFLHPVPQESQKRSTNSAYTALPASKCLVDNLPFEYSQFAMFIPSIMHQIELGLITQHLCNNLLSPIQFGDPSLVTTAISASVAREATNYQRLEFLGDSCLKLHTSINLMAEYPKWHEGYLSGKKDHIVSNGSLASAARRTGLDSYILTKAFTGYRWRPLYISDLLAPQPNKMREMSTKTLADVVEAIIGAAFLDGGPQKVTKCLSIFQSESRWLPLSERLHSLSEVIIPSINFPPNFAELETLIGHNFKSKSLLLEALTHGSHFGSNIVPSYERLEFLGDSVLDSIITPALFNHAPPLPHQTMHLCRTALVNANFLAFLCMDISILTPRSNPVEDKVTGKWSSVVTLVPLSIWQFMRQSSYDVGRAQQRCLSRFHELRPAINDALAHGDRYPWLLLSQLNADKFFSDIIESIIGAIYIDTLGDLSKCEDFLEKLRIAPCLDRLLNGNVRLLHPKEELGRVADDKKVRYEVWIEDERRNEEHLEEAEEKGEQSEEGKSMSAKVFVGDEEIARYSGAKSRIEAETGVAEEALKTLKAQGRKRKAGVQDEVNGKGEEGQEEVEKAQADKEEDDIKHDDHPDEEDDDKDT